MSRDYVKTCLCVPEQSIACALMREWANMCVCCVMWCCGWLALFATNKKVSCFATHNHTFVLTNSLSDFFSCKINKIMCFFRCIYTSTVQQHYSPMFTLTENSHLSLSAVYMCSCNPGLCDDHVVQDDMSVCCGCLLATHTYFNSAI